jgi:hypothetical protein
LDIARSLKSTPGRLRVVDINHDGLPEIMVTLDKGLGGKTQTYLYENHA